MLTTAKNQKSLKALAILLLLGIVFSAFQVSARQDSHDKQKPLISTQLKALLSGNSLAGNGRTKDPAEPYDWIAHYAADGKLTLKLKPEWGGSISKGRWWLTDEGQQCRLFETGHKKEGCWFFYKEGKFVRFKPSGGKAFEGRAVMLPGNALATSP